MFLLYICASVNEFRSSWAAKHGSRGILVLQWAGKLGHLLGPTVSLPQGVHVEGWKPPDMVRHPQSVGLWASREGGRGLQLILLMHVVLIPKRLLIEE